MTLPPLIVGAGPAGIRAAATLVAAGLRPIVIDEAPASGGQIYRQPLMPDGRSSFLRYGSEASKADRLHAEFVALGDRIDYHPSTLVWNIAPGEAHLYRDGTTTRLAFHGAILATGAMDRTLPLPGWTLPGVFTLGGAQIALKAQGAAIGSRVVFLGSGPLLYLVAWQYLKAGVRVAGVLDTAPFSAKFALLRALPKAPDVVMRGLGYVLGLKRAGVPLHFGVKKPRFLGDSRVTGVEWQAGGRTARLDADGIGFGFGLKPEAQLADLMGCTFVFSERDRAHIPLRDPAGRTDVTGLYIAGDAARIMGADAAELAGERAALALLEDRGLPVDRARTRDLEIALEDFSTLRDALEAAFPFPESWVISDETTLCRCEEIQTGEARAAIRHFGISEINRLKAVSRVGMGRCQGRVCGAAAAEVLADETGRPVCGVGRLRAQPPIKPVPLTLITSDTEIQT